MPSDSLRRLALFFDELNRITLWEPEAAQRTNFLKDESKDFINKITEFHTVVREFIEMAVRLGEHVEKEKMKTLGASNLLKSMTKQRECQQQQYQALIIEKSTEMERLRVQHQSLLKIQLEQQEILDQIQN